MYWRTRATWPAAGLCLALALCTTWASAVSTRFGADGRPIRWHQPSVTFLVDPSASSASIPDPLAAVRAAASQWDGVPGVTRLAVSSGVVGPQGASTDGTWRSGLVFYRQGFPMSTTALAVTVLTIDDGADAIVGAHVLVQGSRYPFAQLGPGGLPTVAASPFDFGSVVTHELGHVLGLGEDYGQPAATMFPTASPGDVHRRALSTEDVASIRLAYPPSGSPAARGCDARIAPGATVTPRWSALVGLVLLGTAIARSRRRAPWATAGVMLVILGAPVGSPVGPSNGTVVGVSAHVTQGWIYTTATVAQSDGVVRDVTVLGGRLGGLRQEVLDAQSGTDLVPGARVTLDGDRVRSIAGPDTDGELAPPPYILPSSPEVTSPEVTSPAVTSPASP